MVIPNGVDPETVPDARADRPAGEAPIRLTHIGNVSNGRDRPLDALLDAVRAARLERARRSRCVLVGAMLESIRRANPDLVERRRAAGAPSVAQAEALRRVAESDYALQLNAREFPYVASTKVYEYALLRVPQISLNYGGEVDRLVRDHGFGHSIDLSRRARPGRAAALAARARRGRSRRRFAFDVEPFTHPVLARRYSTLIESL